MPQLVYLKPDERTPFGPSTRGTHSIVGRRHLSIGERFDDNCTGWKKCIAHPAHFNL